MRTVRRDEAVPGFRVVQQYLTRFGYLKEGAYQVDALDTATSKALETFQAFFGLPVSGEFDEPTRNQMAIPRCAHPDVSPADEVEAAFVVACAWNRRRLSFAFDTGTPDIAGTAEFAAVRRAFQTWQQQCSYQQRSALTFSEVASNPDIRVGWRPAQDPDLNMAGPALAHADFPPGCSRLVAAPPLPLHFDDSEQWADGAVSGAIDVESVALHEIGHTIGLMHSNAADAVMNPAIPASTLKRNLTPDDIDGVMRLYRFWSDADLTALAGGPDASGDPVAYVTNLPGQGLVARVVYAGVDDHVHELFHFGPGSSWSHADLTTVSGGGRPVGRPAAYVTDFPAQGPGARVVYRRSNNHLIELWFPASSLTWSSADLTQLSGFFGADAVGDPVTYTTDFPGQGVMARVPYRGADGHIHERYFQP
jgi:hypothetical protein